MQIQNIKLKNFRNHTNKSYDFDENVTLITGPNGAGKTNILEAIYIMATSKSQRARYDRDLINHEQTFCTIDAKTSTQEDEYDLELQVIKQEDSAHTSSKKAKVNKVVKSISGFTGLFNAVMFTPEDISIITGSPSERRRFLDLVLSQTDKKYKRLSNDYLKAIRQRNKLLELINKEGRGYNQMDFWNKQILNLGSEIYKYRKHFIDFANQRLTNLLHKLDKNGSTSEIIYHESQITKERLEKYFEKEIAAKSTLIGPHREDFEITLNERNVADFGSRGQQRTILLSLKLLEIDFIETNKGERPVLLLDDIFSELDELHRQTIINVIDKQQTIISSAENQDILGITFGKNIKL